MSMHEAIINIYIYIYNGFILCLRCLRDEEKIVSTVFVWRAVGRTGGWMDGLMCEKAKVRVDVYLVARRLTMPRASLASRQAPSLDVYGIL